MRYPWQHRIDASRNEDYSQFVTNWLTDGPDTLPSLAIINGWQAEHSENQWIADLYRDRVNVFAYDNRGQGNSPKHGELDAVQNAIDANAIISQAFQSHGGTKHILQGNCIGTMTIAALFAGRLPLSHQIDGVLLLSPVSTFSLPWYLKILYFLPLWLAEFAVKYISPIVMNKVAPQEESADSRESAATRLQRLDRRAALKQVKQIFWKENVSAYWQTIDVPALILVGKNDPLVRYEESLHPFSQLKYPIWYELEAPDHLLLESNINIIRKIVPEFCEDPWNFYHEYRHLKP